MSEPKKDQPLGKAAMSFVKDETEDYLKDQAKEQVTDYVQSDDVQQKVDDAKAEAQGLWAKYCGCFSSAA